MSRILILIFAVLLGLPLYAVSPDQIFPILSGEIDRVFKELRGEEYPPYYLGYSLTDSKEYYISAAYGVLSEDYYSENRILDIDLRVGSYRLDNTHPLRGQSFGSSAIRRGYSIPLGNDSLLLRKALWWYTDKEYRDAVQRYMKVLGNIAVKVEESDTSGDFSKEDPVTHIESFRQLEFTPERWRQIVRRLSVLFAADPLIFQSSVSISAHLQHRYFVNSEGSRVFKSQPYVRLIVYGMTKAEDGMVLPLYLSYFGFSEDDLPSEEKLREDVEEMIHLLGKLRDAPEMESYAGPAILSGSATGVFFHEIFGHRIEGHRLKDVRHTQTLKDYIGKQLFPSFLDVVFDPTVKEFHGQKLAGYYSVDDEGVLAQKVIAVDNGIFKSFLMSRIPIEGFPHSNGHGRSQPGLSPVARQSNLFVIPEKFVSDDSLRSELIRLCKEEGLEYGLFFKTVQGGFTFTQRSIPNAFNVQPLIVYKVFTDGRPDQLVRGVDIIGTPLTAFRFIAAASNNYEIFNGLCGAESGNVPVSTVAPSILLSRIEVQKKQKSQSRLPILPPPVINGVELR